MIRDWRHPIPSREKTMKAAIIATAVILSFFLAPGAFAQSRRKAPAKPQAKSSSRTAKPASRNSKASARDQRNSRNARSGSRNQRDTRASSRSRGSSRNDRNARNSRNPRDSRNARNNRNSRNDRNARNSRSSRTSSRSRAALPSRSSRASARESRPLVPAPSSEPKVSTVAFNRELIVGDPIAPIRGRAAVEAPFVANARLGTVLFASEKNAQWYRVQYSVNGRSNTGWIEASKVAEMSGADRAAVYRRIVDRNPVSEADFTGAVAMYDFLSRVGGEMQPSTEAAELELKRVQALRRAVAGIGRQNRNVSPYADFLREHESDVLFNEATGDFLVSSNLFWNLAEKYRDYGAGDEMAWQAARNPLPGDCGQALSCYLFNLRMSDGEYLAFFPEGRRANEAMRNLSMTLQPMVSDLAEKRLFKVLDDRESRDEFNSLLAELKTIVGRSSAADKAPVIEQLGRIAAAYR